MTGSASGRLIPFGIVTSFLLFVLGTLTLSHINEFRAGAQGTFFNPPHRIDTVLRHAIRMDVHQSLASALASTTENPLVRFANRTAYLILSNATLTRTEAERRFARQARFHFARGRVVTGFDAASRELFGLPLERLSLGEIAFLCRSALDGHPFPPPDRALIVRNRLIDRLYRRGVLLETDVERELAKPFTLAPDPSPIY